MEPKNYKDFNFGRKNIQHNERLCDFYSCWSCQGKEPPDRETLNKIKIINKQKPPRKFNPNAREKCCRIKNCKYCQRILKHINLMKQNYYNNLEIKENTQKNNIIQEQNIAQAIPKPKNALSINLEKDEIKISNTEPDIFIKQKIRGDGNCAYRAIIASLNEKINYITLRQLKANQILLDRIPEDIYKERECDSLIEYTDKIRSSNFYADEPELQAIATLKNIWIAIYIDSKKIYTKKIKTYRKALPILTLRTKTTIYATIMMHLSQIPSQKNHQKNNQKIKGTNNQQLKKK